MVKQSQIAAQVGSRAIFPEDKEFEVEDAPGPESEEVEIDTVKIWVIRGPWA